jgi:integrase/recombinase XerD
MLTEKRDEGLTSCYLTGLRQYLALFSKFVGDVPIDTITAAMLQDWFRSRVEAPSARASNLGRLSALFQFAVRRGYIADNPVRRIRPPKLHTSPPRILSPAEAGNLLVRVRQLCPEILAFVVLGLFVGVRPMECLRLPWSAVDLAAQRLRVDRTKTGKRRVAHLEPAAVAWLEVCDRSCEMMCPSWSTIRRRRRAVWPGWPQDVLRHTAASYLLELHQDAGKVAMWCGNSPRILLRHYHELVSPKDCVAFWELRPDAVGDRSNMPQLDGEIRPHLDAGSSAQLAKSVVV